MPHSFLISDLHLSATHAPSIQAFERFMNEFAPHADAVYVLGDLFEYWAGDDDIQDGSFHQHVVNLFNHVATQHGTRFFIMHGNRDLLMGQLLADACAAALLPDPSVVDLYGVAAVLCHGDTLCTDDAEYQAHRAKMHDKQFQSQFLSQPLSVRQAFIEELRERSRRRYAQERENISDVSNEAVESLFRQMNVRHMVHGHTHRPHLHEHWVDGVNCKRWVLGAWEEQGYALRCDSRNGWEVVRF